MLQLLAHLIGDYLLQNDWMAANKRKGTFACAVHCWLYTLPFIFICNTTLLQSFVIYGSHFLIDRFGLAQYWVQLINWNWNSKNFGFDNNKPQFLSIWLLIIVDNIFHVLCNYLTILFL
jgi:hypothetical protein